MQAQAAYHDTIKQGIWWASFMIALLYALFALYMTLLEAALRLGLATQAPHRAIPLAFLIHASTGAIVLVTGSLQFHQGLLKRAKHLHRRIGYIYVGAIWLSSSTSLILAIFFDVPFAAKVAFGLLALLWFGSTTLALHYARQRQLKKHRHWMLRSYALSYFFVTFSLWMPFLEASPLDKSLSYPLSIVISWALNLLIVELWIYTRRATLVERVG
jgi:hypothetical protein